MLIQPTPTMRMFTTKIHTGWNMRPFEWLNGVLGRGGPQTKKLAFLYGIVVASVWLTIGLWVPIRSEWNVALALFLGAVTTGYVGGKKVAGSYGKTEQCSQSPLNGPSAPPAVESGSVTPVASSEYKMGLR